MSEFNIYLFLLYFPLLIIINIPIYFFFYSVFDSLSDESDLPRIFKFSTKFLIYILLPLFTFFVLVSVPGKSGTNSTISNSSSIILSEIMYDPSGSEHYDEFVEIYNISATNYINLTG